MQASNNQTNTNNSHEARPSLGNAQNHTKGPWQQAKAPNGYRYIWANDGSEICRISGTNALAHGYEKENALLIAAAPELLAALLSIINHANLGAYERANAMNSARKAIKKATGK